MDAFPKRVYGQARDLIYRVWMAPMMKEAAAAFNLFVATFRGKHTHAVE